MPMTPNMMQGMYGQGGGIMPKQPNTIGREYGSMMAQQLSPVSKMTDLHKRMSQAPNAENPWQLAAKKFKGRRRDFPMRTMQGGAR